MFQSISLGASDTQKDSHYQDVIARIKALLEQETDWVAAMATVSCELHHSFGYFHWTGFYRTVAKELLKVGPYQGGHGCLVIPFQRGVCGAAARTQEVQVIDDVNAIADHIACSSTTQSEIVLPIIDKQGQTQAVLDVDSDDPAAFTSADAKNLGTLIKYLEDKFFSDS